MKKTIGRFHLLTDFQFQQTYSHAELARLGAEGGADTIQFRQKIGGIRHVLCQARETAATCEDSAIPLIVNDRIDVALACRADGIHLGQLDFPIRNARELLGDQAIIGATASTVEQALRARDDGADYIGFGPVFATASKANPESVRGLDRLAEVCDALDIPVIAIAGIRASRVAKVLEAGAHGVAVMTAVTTAADPAAAAREIRAAIDEALAARSSAMVDSTNRGSNGFR